MFLFLFSLLFAFFLGVGLFSLSSLSVIELMMVDEYRNSSMPKKHITHGHIRSIVYHHHQPPTDPATSFDTSMPQIC